MCTVIFTSYFVTTLATTLKYNITTSSSADNISDICCTSTTQMWCTDTGHHTEPIDYKCDCAVSYSSNDYLPSTHWLSHRPVQVTQYPAQTHTTLSAASSSELAPDVHKVTWLVVTEVRSASSHLFAGTWGPLMSAIIPLYYVAISCHPECHPVHGAPYSITLP